MLNHHASRQLFPYTTLFRSNATRRGDDERTSPSRRATTERRPSAPTTMRALRSEEHTSELQSHSDLVCRLLLEKKHEGPVQHHQYASHRGPPSRPPENPAGP